MFFKIGSIDPSSAHFEAWLAMDGNVPEAARVPRAGAAAAAAPLSTSPQPPLLHTSQSGEDDAFPLIHPAFWQQCLVHRAPHPAAGFCFSRRNHGYLRTESIRFFLVVDVFQIDR